MLRPQQIVDRYRVEDLVARGGMASVYKVRHHRLNSLHAIKVLFLSGDSVRKRLMREGRVQASLRHQNIVAVTDVLEIEGSPALVMEYVDGPALDAWMLDHDPTIAEALQIFRGIVLGVAHAHSLDIAHRDLKPANVLLASTNDGLIPKVTDFGLMKALNEEAKRVATLSGVAMGTPNYMSPEQIRDAATVDKRTDVFALGCILYELIAGVEAFPGASQFEVYRMVIEGAYKPLTDHVPDVPRRISRAIDLCLMTERDQRLDDCDMLFDLLYERQNVTVGAMASMPRDDALQLSSLSSARAALPRVNAPDTDEKPEPTGKKERVGPPAPAPAPERPLVYHPAVLLIGAILLVAVTAMVVTTLQQPQPVQIVPATGPPAEDLAPVEKPPD